MKSTIVKCLQDMVLAQNDNVTWRAALEHAGLSPWTRFMTAGNVDDALILPLFEGVSQATGDDLQTVMDRFGIYWSTVYAPEIYPYFFKNYDNAHAFIKHLSDIHRMVTHIVPGAKPPRFESTWVSPTRLHMRYHSERGLSGLIPGLIMGIGQYYGEVLRVCVHAEDNIEIDFDTASQEVMG